MEIGDRRSKGKEKIAIILNILFVINLLVNSGISEYVIFFVILTIEIILDLSPISNLFFLAPANRMVKHFSSSLLENYWMLFVFASFLLNEAIHGRFNFEKNKMIVVFISVLLLVSGLTSVLFGTLSIANFIIGIAQYILFMPFIFGRADTEKQIRYYLFLTIISTTIINITGIVEIYVISAIIPSAYYSDISVYSRLNPSLGLDILDWGLVCGVSILCSLSIIKSIKIKTVIIAINLFSLILTQDRASLMFLLLTVILYSRWKIKLKKKNIISIMAVSIIFIFVILINYNTYVADYFAYFSNRLSNVLGQESIISRVRTWAIPDKYNLTSIFLGLGPGYFYDKYKIESQYVKMFYEIGIVNFFLFAVITTYYGVILIKNKRKNDRLMGMILFYLTMDFFVIATLSSTVINFYYWFFLSSCMNSANKYKKC